jgi:hypothetical protein
MLLHKAVLSCSKAASSSDVHSILGFPFASSSVSHAFSSARCGIYHTIGRYLALPTGSIRAGQNSPYFDNYMQEGKYGPGKYDSIFARLLFPNLFRRRLPSPISKHNNCASARKFIT